MLARGQTIHEVRYGNVSRETKAYDIKEDGFEAYLEFNSLEAALNMHDNYEIDGHLINLWHKGRQF